MDSRLLVSQYNTSPDGKKKNMKAKLKGMSHIILACVGSAGLGLSQTCNRLEAVIRIGRMYSGSGADKSLTHRIQGAPRISTVARGTEYWRALLGGIILLLVLLFPQGLAGFARQWFGRKEAS